MRKDESGQNGDGLRQVKEKKKERKKKERKRHKTEKR